MNHQRVASRLQTPPGNGALFLDGEGYLSAAELGRQRRPLDHEPSDTNFRAPPRDIQFGKILRRLSDGERFSMIEDSAENAATLNWIDAFETIAARRD
jgi:hypothetical protein